MRSFFESRLIKANSGFTLVELMVVIAIISVSLIIAIPTYHLTIKPTVSLNGAARQLYSDVQLTRLRAVSDNTRCGLVFFAAPPRYTIFRDSNNNSQYDAGEEVIKTVDLSKEYPKIQYDTSQGGGDGISFVNNSFSMTSKGVAAIQGATDGKVYLINNKGKGRRIDVNIMGGVRLEKY